MFFAKAVFNQNIKLSGQLILVLTLLFGLHSTAYGKDISEQFKPTYKLNKCDCFGFSQDIPTFLSDLPGTEDINIFGEGSTIKKAQKEAQNMCVENYRNFASVSQAEHPNSVTYSGCQTLRSTPDGGWVSI